MNHLVKELWKLDHIC